MADRKEVIVMNGKEAFTRTKGFMKENGARTALGVSLAINAGLVLDAGVNNGDALKSVINVGGEMVNDMLEEICFYPEYEAQHPEECVKEDFSYPPTLRMW